MARYEELPYRTCVGMMLINAAGLVFIGGRTWKGRYRGQRQKWFAVRFTGKDSEINVANPGGGHKAEFVSWRWEPMKNLPELIVPFKRPVYERVVKEFSRLAGG